MWDRPLIPLITYWDPTIIPRGYKYPQELTTHIISDVEIHIGLIPPPKYGHVVPDL